MAKGLCRKGSLHNILVQAPVVKVWNPQAYYKSRPWKHGMVSWQNTVEFVRVCLKEVAYSDLLKTKV